MSGVGAAKTTRTELDYKYTDRAQGKDPKQFHVNYKEVDKSPDWGPHRETKKITISVTITPQKDAVRDDASFNEQIQHLYPGATLQQLKESPELEGLRAKWNDPKVKSLTFPLKVTIPAADNAQHKKDLTPPKQDVVPPKTQAPADSKSVLAGMDAVVAKHPKDPSAQNKAMAAHLGTSLKGHEGDALAQDVYKSAAKHKQFWPTVLNAAEPTARADIAMAMWPCFTPEQKKEAIGILAKHGDAATAAMLISRSKPEDAGALISAATTNGMRLDTLLSEVPDKKRQQELKDAAAKYERTSDANHPDARFVKKALDPNTELGKFCKSHKIGEKELDAMFTSGNFEAFKGFVLDGLKHGSTEVAKLLGSGGAFSRAMEDELAKDPGFAHATVKAYDSMPDKLGLDAFITNAMLEGTAREMLLDELGSGKYSAATRDFMENAALGSSNAGNATLDVMEKYAPLEPSKAGTIKVADSDKVKAFNDLKPAITRDDLEKWYTTGKPPPSVDKLLDRVASGKGTDGEKALAQELLQSAVALFSERGTQLKDDARSIDYDRAQWSPNAKDHQSGVTNHTIVAQKQLAKVNAAKTQPAPIEAEKLTHDAPKPLPPDIRYDKKPSDDGTRLA